MDIRFSSPVLMVEDFEHMIAFYRDILGQEIEVDFGNCALLRCGISIWKMDPRLPLAKKLGRSFDPSGNRNLELCFETEDFDAVAARLDEQLRAHGLEYVHGILEEPWGQRTVRFYDPEKNLVELGESVPCFVRRFHEQGLNEEEVSARCHVPPDMVRSILEKDHPRA